MTKTYKVIICLILTYCLFAGCQETNQAVIDPNKSSELAILMREIFEEAERIKKQVENGEKVALKINYEDILTAHATEPDKAASEEYKAFAGAYLQTMKSLETATPDQVSGIYHDMVHKCMTCHQAMCPGPIVRIKKLQ